MWADPETHLSREASTALRIITENFPTVGETLHLSKAMALYEDPDGSQRTIPAATPPTPESALNSLCNCPRHQTPPPPNYYSQSQRLTSSAYRHGS